VITSREQVNEVREKLSATHNVNADKLIHQGKVLVFEKLISEYEIQDGHQIVMMIKKNVAKVLKKKKIPI
jgi:hypothetical protein